MKIKALLLILLVAFTVRADDGNMESPGIVSQPVQSVQLNPLATIALEIKTLIVPLLP